MSCINQSQMGMSTQAVSTPEGSGWVGEGFGVGAKRGGGVGDYVGGCGGLDVIKCF